MKRFSDKTQRTIFLLLESHELNALIHKRLKELDFHFDEKEIELKYDFVEEGSPAYKTGKVKCTIKIVKDIENA